MSRSILEVDVEVEVEVEDHRSATLFALSRGPRMLWPRRGMRIAVAAAVVTGLSCVASCADRRPTDDAPALAAAASLAPAESSAAPVPAPPPTASSPPPLDDRPRVFARTRMVPIHADGSLRGKWIGTLAAGDSVLLRDGEPAHSTPSCPSIRAVQPRGWVCVDGDKATTDPHDPVWLALRAHMPDYTSPWPYWYGESRGARRHKSLDGIETPPWPGSLADPHPEIAARSTVAWTDEVESGGQRWLWASDASFVRKDRVAPFDRVDFHGVDLGGDIVLPIAFFKRGPHAKHHRDADGRLVATGEAWPRLGWVALTGRNEKHSGVTFWETREADTWIDAREAAVVAPPEHVSPLEGEPKRDGVRRTWIEVAALQGWLVAYEEDTPVMATLISAGKLGAARPEADREPHVPAATTPLGTFRMKEKFLTTTLQSDLDDGTEFVHAEVPWSQRFYDKYLLHTAYWHDQWGEGRSGGCVNLSPIDAKRLFAWTEPRLPEGWHAVRSSDTDDQPATLVVLHP
jgi:lipoprotein-anchoring transpeptidase ErfK/SrfK